MTTDTPSQELLPCPDRKTRNQILAVKLHEYFQLSDDDPRSAELEAADELAEAIASYFGEETGEHSNNNCPWENALEIIASHRARSSQGDVVKEISIAEMATSMHTGRLLAALEDTNDNLSDAIEFLHGKQSEDVIEGIIQQVHKNKTLIHNCKCKFPTPPPLPSKEAPDMNEAARQLAMKLCNTGVTGWAYSDNNTLTTIKLAFAALRQSWEGERK